MSVFLWALVMFWGGCYLIGQLWADISCLEEWRARNLEKSAHMWYNGNWRQKIWAVVLLWGCNAALLYAWFIRLGFLVLGGVILLFVYALIRA